MSEFTDVKDPDGKVNWIIDWSDWLDGDTISTSTWSIAASESPITLTVVTSGIQSDTTVSPNLASQWSAVTVSSGTAGITYTLTNHIVTANGFEDDRSIQVRVWNR